MGDIRAWHLSLVSDSVLSEEAQYKPCMSFFGSINLVAKKSDHIGHFAFEGKC